MKEIIELIFQILGLITNFALKILSIFGGYCMVNDTFLIYDGETIEYQRLILDIFYGILIILIVERNHNKWKNEHVNGNYVEN